MKTHQRRLMLTVAALFGAGVISACTPAPIPPPAAPPPVGSFNPGETPPPTGDVPDAGVNPPVDGGVVVNPPDAGPPPPPPPVDCSALLYNGQTYDCDAEFGTEAGFCENLYPTQQGETPNFGLLNACGACDAKYYAPPAGVTECPGGGNVGNPDDPCAADPTAPGCQLAESSCKRCHAPAGYNGLHSIEDPHPFGAQAGMDCTSCHGGDGQASNPVFAHVCAPPEIGDRQQQFVDPRAFFLRFTLAGVQLLNDYQCPKPDGTLQTVKATQYLAFLNPGDLRAGREGYGCARCHSENGARGDGIFEAVNRSVMGNATGLNGGTRHGIGAPNAYPERNGNNAQNDYNTLADYAANNVTNPNYDPNNRIVGEVGSVKQAEVFTTGNFRYDQQYTADAVNNSLNINNLNADNYPNGVQNGVAAQLFQEVLNQACTGCHLQNNYNNFRAGDFRTSGCSQCHFSTQVTGRSASTDPNVNKIEPVNVDALTPGEHAHRRDHRIRNVARLPNPQYGQYQAVQGIDDGRCIVCHEGSNRTVAQYHGYRLDQNQDLTNDNFYPSQNAVTFTYKQELFGENNTFNGRVLEQWISTEVWQQNANNAFEANITQDETPEDVHHAAGLGCIDCHGTGATHGRGKIYSRMKAQVHENDVSCETCHGTIDAYAANDGTHILDNGNAPLPSTVVNNATTGEFWLVSKLTGGLHYIPQVKDVVDYSGGIDGNGKQRPDGTPVFNLVASYAMGRFDTNGGGLQDGLGPVQNNIQVKNGFSHGDGYNGARGENQGVECYTCHAAWQNNCVGCHLTGIYDGDPNNYFFSQVTGERIWFNFAADFVYQNPINFMMGINDKGRISPYQGMHRFFRYIDFNQDTSNFVSYGDRNGLGNDPALRNPNRNNLPALQNQPFTPHSIRARWTADEVGMRGCLDCHVGNADAVILTNQQNNTFDLRNVNNNDLLANYDAAIAFNVNMAYGLGSNLWQFDADGQAVVDSNNAPVYDLDRIVEANGVSNSSSNHPLLDPLGANSNADYFDRTSTNQAAVARPLTGTVLQRLNAINQQGLGNVYYYSLNPENDIGYWLRDYNYVGQ